MFDYKFIKTSVIRAILKLLCNFIRKTDKMKFLKYIILLSFFQTFSQEEFSQTVRDTTFFTRIDSLYREDQLYFAITYNRLVNSPNYFDQNGIPIGLHLGFQRDMPINKSRTVAFALGLGISYNKYHQNLKMIEENGIIDYEIVSADSFSRNKLEQFYIDIPFEFRWRTSTPESHKFFRFHAGFKLRYLAFSKSKYIGDEGVHKIFNNKDFNKIQYGPTISLGYNTWNFYAYYGLNSLMKNVDLNGEKVDFKTLNLGLIFYIL